MDLRPSQTKVMGGAVAIAMVLTMGACNDATSTIYPVRHATLTRVEALTAFPAFQAADGSWARQCGAGAFDGLLVDIAAVGAKQSSDGTEASLVGIAPGDRVDFTQKLDASSADGLSIALDCEESVETSGEACAGWTPEATRAGAAYVAPKGGEAGGEKHVVILIDQSGSTSGLVDAEQSYREAGVGEFTIPENFGSIASDPSNLRIAAGRRVIRSLGDEDEVCVLAFGEDINLRVARPDAELATCFDAASLDDWLTGNQSLSSLSGTGQGRSPLWRAVDTAWDVLAANATEGASDHVLVIDDGPDTCTGEARTGCVACAVTGASFEDVTARIAAEDVAPVDFIQFSAPGYPDRDPRQMQVACATGGQYLFVPGAFGYEADITAFMEGLGRAVTDVMASWDGVWRVALALGQDPPDTARGVVNGLSGAVTVAASSGLVPADTRYPFGVLSKADGAGVDWDHRLPIRRACQGATDCGGEPANACLFTCSAETLLCSDDPAGDPLPNGTSCDGGACCDGACSESGGCCTE